MMKIGLTSLACSQVGLFLNYCMNNTAQGQILEFEA